MGLFPLLLWVECPSLPVTQIHGERLMCQDLITVVFVHFLEVDDLRDAFIKLGVGSMKDGSTSSTTLFKDKIIVGTNYDLC